jgi:hypothetical protein
MKYKCADGSNRDKWIDRCLKIEKRAKILKRRIAADQEELAKIHEENRSIRFNWLGAVGASALAEAREIQ